MLKFHKACSLFMTLYRCPRLLTEQRMTGINELNIAFQGKELFLDTECSRHPEKCKGIEAGAMNNNINRKTYD